MGILKLITMFLLSAYVYAANIYLPSAADGDVSWEIIHPIKAKDKTKGNLGLLEFKLRKTFEEHSATFRKRYGNTVRVAVEVGKTFPAEHRAVYERVAHEFGFDVEVVEGAVIDWQQRSSNLTEAAIKMVEATADRLHYTLQQKRIAIEEFKIGAKEYWSSIYHKPTRAEVMGGIATGAVAIVLPMWTWLDKGAFEPVSAAFFVMVSAHIVQETFFSVCYKTYEAILAKTIYQKIEAFTSMLVEKKILPESMREIHNLLGVGLFDAIQRFFIWWAGDKAILHHFNPDKFKPLWGTIPDALSDWHKIFGDWPYWVNYWTYIAPLAFPDTLLYLANNKFVQKGWISRDKGSIAVQAILISIPVQGALLSENSDLYKWIAGARVIADFATYLIAAKLPYNEKAGFYPPNKVKADCRDSSVGILTSLNKTVESAGEAE